jgi:hypothetical protein
MDQELTLRLNAAAMPLRRGSRLGFGKQTPTDCGSPLRPLTNREEDVGHVVVLQLVKTATKHFADSPSSSRAHMPSTSRCRARSTPTAGLDGSGAALTVANLVQGVEEHCRTNPLQVAGYAG